MKDEKEKQGKEKKELEAINNARFEEIADKMKEELENRAREFEASISKLRIKVEESSRKECGTNFTKNALMKPSHCDFPIVERRWC